ncbi:MAG TPA: hypothetical protein VGS21_12010 [Acidimicrobiales bacterium]|nr:hypothetical protein [Acidimicrobiales bacterium]
MKNRLPAARRGTRILPAAVASGLLVLAASAGLAGSTAAAPGHGSPELLGMRTSERAASGTSGGNLVDHGGKVLSTSHTYVIWWGSASAWSSDVEGGIASFFSGTNGSSWLNTGTQYMRGASISSAYEGSKTDSSSPPKKVSATTLGNEVAKEYGTSLDPDGVYFVYTSNFPNGGNFCAWHSLATVNGQKISVAYMPNTTNVSGCDPGNLYGVPGSEGLRSLVNVTSHEYMESLTDALPASATYGWIDSSGSEIGDKCAWKFSSAVSLGGSTWQLQEEWSNAVSGCVQTS